MTFLGDQKQSVGNITQALEELEIRYYQTLNDLRLTREENMLNAIRYIELMDELNSKNEILDKQNRELEFLTKNLEKTVKDKVEKLIETNRDLEKEIEQRAKTEKTLAETLEKAEIASKVKSEFLANMSHEIRTPMSGVIGMSGLLKDTDLSEEQTDYVNSIVSSAEALLVIIDDILDLSKIESHKMNIERVPFDLRKSVEELVKTASVAASKKNIDLILDMKDDFDYYVKGDSIRIWQVLNNLLGNAVKFTDKGSVKLTVIPDRIKGKNYDFLFTVEDTGVGIDPEKIHEIFNIFSQEDGSTARRFGGSGLGLSISKRLVELMGGEIGVESSKGKGAKFFFNIPMQTCSESDILKEDLRRDDYYGKMAKEHVSILVVEDNPVNRQLIVKILSQMGFNVDAAPTGREGIKMFKSKPYELVFMDIQMPDMDGLEVTARMRELEKKKGTKTPVVALTANAMVGAKSEYLSKGMDDYLTKPIKMDAIKKVLNKFL